jgi:hypothetical protein
MHVLSHPPEGGMLFSRCLSLLVPRSTKCVLIWRGVTLLEKVSNNLVVLAIAGFQEMLRVYGVSMIGRHG